MIHKDTQRRKEKGVNPVSFQMFYAMIEANRDATTTHNLKTMTLCLCGIQNVDINLVSTYLCVCLLYDFLKKKNS